MKTIDQLRYEFGGLSGGSIEDYVYEYMEDEIDKLRETLNQIHTRNHELLEQSTYWMNKYENLKGEIENVSDFFAKYEKRVI